MSDADDPIQYDNEPSRIRKGSEFSRRFFGFLGIRSARDERQNNYQTHSLRDLFGLSDEDE
jgi:hypothetical protein